MRSPGSSLFIGTVRKVLTKIQTNVATQTPMSSIFKNDAAATESEIPVPNAT
jgi:hypothetical protein